MHRISIDFPLDDLPTDPKEVSRLIEEISNHPDVIEAHHKWEDYDQKWKDVTKARKSAVDIMKAAALVRESRKYKDEVSDIAAELACKVAENSGIIQEYTKDYLGVATRAGSAPELSVGWHNLRRKGLGGSSISSSLGFHWKTRNGSPVMTSGDEYAEMLADTAISKMTPVTHAEEPTSGVLYRGHMWEPATLVWLAINYGINVAVSKDTWAGKHPLQIINTDGIILDDDGEAIGMVECKTSSRKWTWGWGVPTNYRAQVLWYLNSTGLDFAYLIVRFDDGTFDVHTIKADETIDGTKNTYPIDHPKYIGELESVWEKVGYYTENKEQLWEDHPRLIAEKNATLGYCVSPGVFDEQFFEDIKDSVVVQGTPIAPYERMDEKFTRFSTFTAGDTTYQIENIPYPVYSLSDKPVGDLPKTRTQNIHTLCGDGLVVAVDTPTYKTLTRMIGSDGVLCASSLRRMYDLTPGKEDFANPGEFHEWLEEKKG